MIKHSLIAILAIFQLTVSAQEYVQRWQEVDVQDYNMAISIFDTTDVISVNETVTILFKQPLTTFYLNLVKQLPGEKGMRVLEIKEGNKPVKFGHVNDRLIIYAEDLKEGEQRVFNIRYEGVPKDGLVISKNKFGDRTFFGDNWPNRAQNWIACVDHPSDKASISFEVEAPLHYSIVANGRLQNIDTLAGARQKVSYVSTIPLPTKVMVFGAANFDVTTSGAVNEIPVTSWVYPQNQEKGHYDFAIAPKILGYFTLRYGPYPYEKLANVQSTTRYGGMENAGCIFYDENSITGLRSNETLLVHEIAHQWFGNSATEWDWPHLWLSEGFATYLTNHYIEENMGKMQFEAQMTKDRNRVISYYKRNQNPIIDTISINPNDILNPNVYEKASWVLHMLRNKVGDELFWKTIADYYQKFQLKNAETKDFIKLMEETTDMDLKSFFDQWMRQSGHPVIHLDKKTQGKNTLLTISQVQENVSLFQFPLDLEIEYEDHSKEILSFDIKGKTEVFTFPNKGKIRKITLDPSLKLLFEEN